jgi:RNA polymerase sigma factor (sigma-70 family)
MTSPDPIQAALDFQKGSEKAFEYFFKLLRPRLEYYAFRILDDKDEAADVVEDSFINIWATHQTFSHPKIIKSWLYTTVRNTCFKLIQRKKVFGRIEKDLIILSAPDIEDSKENQMIRAEVIGEIYYSFGNLPEDCRKILSLLYKDGLTVKEVSLRLDLSLSCVKTQKGRGLQMIRDMVLHGIVPAGVIIRMSSEKKKKVVEYEKKQRDERKERNEKIVKLRNKGWLFKDIAKKVFLHPVSCQQIYLKQISKNNTP